jgi:HK97 family phage major capsid protein
MNQQEIQVLRDRRQKLLADARTLNETGTTEKPLSAEDDAKVRQMLTDARALGSQIAREEELDREERTTLPDTARVPPGGDHTGEDPTQDQQIRRFLRAAFEGRGPSSLDITGERRDMSTLGLTVGGATVVPDTSMYGQVIEALQFFGGVEAFGASVINTSTGADLPIATEDDTANEGAIVAEEGSHTGGADKAMGQKVLRAYVFSSKVIKFSMQLEEDASFPIVPWLSRNIGTRVGRHENRKFTLGTGVSEPQGVQVGVSVGRQGSTGHATTVDFDELKRAKHSLDIAYRNGARWMFSDATALAIALLKDGNGRYLLQDAVSAGDTVQMLLGHPVVINNHMPDMAASVESILFGQGSAYYIRRVTALRIAVLRELYIENGQVGIIGFMRADGGLIDAGAIKAWQNSAA